MSARELGETSLRRTKEKDRDGWLALFADDAFVEDPVGRGRHAGVAAIAEFYDSTISTMDSFDYEIERCYLCGGEAAMVVSFVIEIGGGRLEMDVVNVYAATDDGHIASLRSFWDGSKHRS